MLSHDAGSVQRGTVLETRLVGLHVCSLPSQLLANAAIAASRVASYLRRSVSEGPKKEPRPKAGLKSIEIQPPVHRHLARSCPR